MAIYNLTNFLAPGSGSGLPAAVIFFALQKGKIVMKTAQSTLLLKTYYKWIIYL